MTRETFTIRTGWRLRALLLALALLLAVGLTACGGDDGDDDGDSPAVPDSDTVEDGDGEIDFDRTPTAIPTPVPDDQLDIAPTLTLDEETALFQDAAAEARLDVADSLGISFEDVSVLDPETALLLPESLDCPDVDYEGAIDVYLVYVQYEATIYPYQFYRVPPGAGAPEAEESAAGDEAAGEAGADADADGADADPDGGDTLLAQDGDLIVEPCAETLVDQDVLTVPESEGPGTVLDLVRADLTAREVDAEAGTFTTVSRMTWTNAALGCAPPQDPTQDEPNPTPAPALVDGYLIIYEVDGQQYEYHTDLTGEQIVYCEPPIGYASVEAFISVLTQEGVYDVVELDETTTYDGLDAEARLIGLLPQEYRVGLLGFETPEAARAAADQIDASDEDVAHIFVSGYIVIVLEENSPQAYSVLLSYAVLVRSPIDEREQMLEGGNDFSDEADDADTDESDTDEGDSE